jgi:hypothetical protein
MFGVKAGLSWEMILVSRASRFHGWNDSSGKV